MSDLLVRLRNPAWTHSEPSGRLEIHYGTAEADMKEAADILERKDTEIAKLRATNDRLGKWMSAALDDPGVCAEMKDDITAWFNAFEQQGERDG